MVQIAPVPIVILIGAANFLGLLLAVLFKVVAGVFPRTDALVLRRTPLAVPRRPTLRAALPVHVVAHEVRGRVVSLRRDRRRGEQAEDERGECGAAHDFLKARGLGLGLREKRGLVIGYRLERSHRVFVPVAKC